MLCFVTVIASKLQSQQGKEKCSKSLQFAPLQIKYTPLHFFVDLKESFIIWRIWLSRQAYPWPFLIVNGMYQNQLSSVASIFQQTDFPRVAIFENKQLASQWKELISFMLNIQLSAMVQILWCYQDKTQDDTTNFPLCFFLESEGNSTPNLILHVKFHLASVLCEHATMSHFKMTCSCSTELRTGINGKDISGTISVHPDYFPSILDQFNCSNKGNPRKHVRIYGKIKYRGVAP